eukprot:TRINITY_DN1273_c0_g1_i2.p2 TRINITY_DN1273_c0_g1~~TRINITY_DN1273_c0_g1_i2.p2  ORF type:complete len:186 (+),score=18.64 TRINITY_DN1273_c0_g1_i2:237-794(+)
MASAVHRATCRIRTRARRPVRTIHSTRPRSRGRAVTRSRRRHSVPSRVSRMMGMKVNGVAAAGAAAGAFTRRRAARRVRPAHYVDPHRDNKRREGEKDRGTAAFRPGAAPREVVDERSWPELPQPDGKAHGFGSAPRDVPHTHEGAPPGAYDPQHPSEKPRPGGHVKSTAPQRPEPRQPQQAQRG